MEPGTQAGRYRLLREIGRGGMGTVYLAVDETVERHELAESSAGSATRHPAVALSAVDEFP